MSDIHKKVFMHMLLNLFGNLLQQNTNPWKSSQFQNSNFDLNVL